MTAFITYCSAKKDKTPGTLPAITRYHSDRIRRVSQASEELGLRFFILSGVYGIVAPGEEISYYDHLLGAAEVDAHVAKVTAQLSALGVTDILFFSVSPDEDEHVVSYIDCIECAAAKVGAGFKLLIVPLSD